ncbi:MAG: hypothetical protein GX424_06305 [Clostridiales bacterium]|jgi:uncharacterized membrane protein|nr:hypothetical protein [Clostridiales bacterium]
MNDYNPNSNSNGQQPPQDQGQPFDPGRYGNSQQYGPGGYPPYQQPPVPPPPPPYRQPYAPETEKLFCVLAYIPFLWLVGLFADRENPDVRFHVNQGIILTVFTVLCGVVVSILHNIITLIFTVSFYGTMFFAPLGALVNGLLSLAQFGLFVAFAVTGILHAAQNRREPLPIIGNLFHAVK